MECICLRVIDIDFEEHKIIVRGGKGDDDRFTVLPDAVAADFQHILQDLKALHEKELRHGYGEVALPNALGVKYKNTGKEGGWQSLFPAWRFSLDPVAGVIRRHHLDETILQKAIRIAARHAKIDKEVSAHTIRRSFGTQLLQGGYDTRHLRPGQVYALCRNGSVPKMGRQP